MVVEQGTMRRGLEKSSRRAVKIINQVLSMPLLMGVSRS